jgi:hypothetical protein
METIIENTRIKINTKPVKDLIKTYVDKQKFYKNAMKNATFTYDQKDAHIIWDPMHPSKAQSEANYNGKLLRLMYAAYGLLRGKSFSQTENHYPEETHPLKNYTYINKLLEDYKILSTIKEE